MKQSVLVGIFALLALPTAFSDPPTGCQHFIDVIAVVDGSGSIASTDFREVRAALKDFVRDLGVSSSVRFGVIIYSHSVGDVIPLSGDASDLTNKINNLAQPGGGTRTDLGIAKMIQMFSGSSSPKVGIVITDGKSSNTAATLTQAANAKNQNINMFAIGVGTNINSEELNGIASSTDQVLLVTNYTLLAQQITSLVVDICPNPPTGCQHFIDVIAVVDGSGSIASTDFREVRAALKDFVRDLGVSSSVRFGVIIYSHRVGDVIPLSGDASDLTNKIKNLAQPGGGTRTDLGIAEMIQMFSGSSSPKVGIVITDGKSSNTAATLTQAANAKNQNINMFAIGVGTNINSEELNGIASSTDQVLLVTNYTLLAQQITSLVVDICPTTQSTNPCDGCKMLNGIGYNPHTDCDKFIQCEFTADLTLLRYHEKQCGYGTFWDQDELTCDHIGSVACDNDPCKAKLDGYSYKTNGNCSQYYRCVDGKTQVRQCPTGYSYDSILGYCVVNTTCKNPIPIPETCEYRGRINDRCNYDWVTGSGTFYKLPCPPGTTFNQADCRCDTKFGASCYPPCKPIVDIQFDSNDSGEYDNYGAIISNGEAYFDGNATIRILTLANVDFRSKVNIKVRYHHKFYSSQGQAVVTNGDCGKQPSISIVSKQYTAQFNLEDTTTAVHSLGLNTNDQWRDVEYSLKDGQFTAKVNSLSTMESIPADVGILRSQCAFLLGQGTGFQNFKDHCINMLDSLLADKLDDYSGYNDCF